MDRSNHYEAAFEGYLQCRRLSYVAVDESRRSFLGDERVKSLDFIVHGENGSRWLVDVKGRRYPGGRRERPRKIWECWSTREDVTSLEGWRERFGPGYGALLLFMYEVMPFASVLPDDEELWSWHERSYLLRAVPVKPYGEVMRRRSPRWGTVSLAAAEYRRLARPFHDYIFGPLAKDVAAEGEEAKKT